MNAPEISICIPSYNGRKHLSECINSIVAQTFKNFEVLICDDQSSDGTLDYARELAKGDERFRFIPNPRRFGLVGNWNNCVEQARSEWIKFVFQDDVIMPACLEKLLAACQRESKPFGFCERDFIFEDGSELPSFWFAAHKQKLQSAYQAKPVISAEQAARLAASDLSLNPVGEPTVTLINKKLFRELRGFDDAFIQLCDSDFWYRVMVNHGAAFVPESLAAFRIHGEATTVKNHAKREFRMKTLDPLVLEYKFAFKKDFKAARNPRLIGKSILALRWKFMNSAAWAKAHAKYINNTSGDDSLLKEWIATVSHYPGLETVARVGGGFAFLRRIKNGVKRRVLRPEN